MHTSHILGKVTVQYEASVPTWRQKCKQHYQIYGLIESKPPKAYIFGSNLNKAIACEDNIIFSWQISQTRSRLR